MISKLKGIAALSAAIVVTFLSVGSPAYAQRDSGAKARGEFGSGFWQPRYGAREYSPVFVETPRSFSYQPQVEPGRTYSYEPAPAAAVPSGCGAVAAPVEAARVEAERRSFSYEPAPLISPAPRYQRGSQPRNSIERRLRPGVGFWE